MKRTILLATFATFASHALAQTGDAPPVDAGQLLQSLKQIREINMTGIKTRRSQALSQISAAAQSAEKAVALWKDAVKAVQFEGAKNAGTAMHNWKEGEGDALGSKLSGNAARLHLQWVALSLQHSAGTDAKQLLPQVIEFTKQLQLDEAAADRLDEQIKREHERGGPMQKQNIEDAASKRMHDQLLRTSITESPVARWLQLGELLSEYGAKTKGEPSAWEMTPGNLEGIYQAVILPQFRAAKDPRILEYWDLTIKRATERAADRKLDIEQREWTQVKRPALIWARAQDVLLLGFRNRAINEMFSVLKTFPHHPESQSWASQLEELIRISTPAPAAAPSLAPRATVPPSTPSSQPSPAVPGAATLPAPPESSR